MYEYYAAGSRLTKKVTNKTVPSRLFPVLVRASTSAPSYRNGEERQKEINLVW
jgi:hypothetical protein